MKSFILSFTLTAIVCVYFMSLFDKKTNAFYRSFPDWVFIAAAIIFFVGYVLSFYWGITGIFKGQRLFNFLGIGFSLLGLGAYALGFIMSNGNGKERAGQFDHDLNMINITQRAGLDRLLQQTDTKTTDVKMIPFWGMHKNQDDFVVCIQKGNIIALQVKNKTITDINCISEFKQLSWLVMENCNIKSIAGLNLPSLERLIIDHNQLTTLSGLENSPHISWLNFRNNPIIDSSALKQLVNKDLYIVHE